MIWSLDKLIRSANEVQTCFPGTNKYIPMRPENYKYRSLWEKCKDAWAVFTGKAEAFRWPGGQ